MGCINPVRAHNKKLAFLILIPIFALFIIMASCKQRRMECCWSEGTMLVDGERTDWSGKPTAYFEDFGVQIGFCNDADNLYILFSFTGLKKARIISMSGLTLWLDSSGERKKYLGIRFISGSSISEIQNQESSAGKRMFLDHLNQEQIDYLLKKRLLMADKITIIDNVRNREVIVSTDGYSGPTVRFNARKRIYTYEFRIPLRETGDDSYSLIAKPGQPISLGLEWGGNMDDLEHILREIDARRDRDGNIGIFGNENSQQYLPERKEVWLTTMLASPPAGQ